MSSPNNFTNYWAMPGGVVDLSIPMFRANDFVKIAFEKAREKVDILIPEIDQPHFGPFYVSRSPDSYAEKKEIMPFVSLAIPFVKSVEPRTLDLIMWVSPEEIHYMAQQYMCETSARNQGLSSAGGLIFGSRGSMYFMAMSCFLHSTNSRYQDQAKSFLQALWPFVDHPSMNGG